jgi:hypothetical protein
LSASKMSFTAKGLFELLIRLIQYNNSPKEKLRSNSPERVRSTDAKNQLLRLTTWFMNFTHRFDLAPSGARLSWRYTSAGLKSCASDVALSGLAINSSETTKRNCVSGIAASSEKAVSCKLCAVNSQLIQGPSLSSF